ncbi:hypothetical protein BUE93_20765 [Chromobacterium amazonense]|uniref:Uncharacterized protein n=1 Tax=Chromobacterium amazonense TaxID=1382803 RepID=A0A2S9WZ52_9NEIS|nr:hypothetical protein BUE93_20765 [Chromobacterium amazonense]
MTVHQAAEANTQAVARAKPQYTELTDSLGRVIKLRKLNPIEQSRLLRAVGSDNATNAAFMNAFAFPAAMVAYIDGEPYGLPDSIAEIEMVLGDLDEAGLIAIALHLEKLAKEANEKAKQMAAEEAEAAKN